MKPPRKLDALTGPPELLEKVGGSAGAVATVTSPDWLEDNAAIMPWIVFAFAFFSRFWRLDQPRGVVFDEVRMGGGSRRPALRVFRRLRSHSPHPPLSLPDAFWAVHKPVHAGAVLCACNPPRVVASRSASLAAG